MTPDLAYSIAVHRKELRRIWNSGEWKAANRVFHDKHPDNTCERCGQIGKIVPGHCDEDYQDMPSYIQKVRDNRVQALCPRCNRWEHKGKKPCPVCIKEGVESIWYIPQHEEVCFNHLPEAEQHRIWIAQRRRESRKHKHPCKFHGILQSCSNQKHLGACDRSPKTADGCDHYLVKSLF
jgi:hypothetical protein